MSNKGTNSIKNIPQNGSWKLKSELRGPKSGSRKPQKGDNAKYDAGYDRIWSKPPVCTVCKGLRPAGTCPVCDGE